MRALALALAAVAGLTACGGSSGGQPQTLPPVTTSPAAAVSPTPAPTGINAATPQGASEFVRFFYAEISRAFAQRDPSPVSALSLPSCKTCKLYIDSITEIRDKHERFEGSGFQIKFAVAPADTGRTTSARVDVGYDFGGGAFYDATGKVLSREKAEADIEEQVALARVAGNWRVATIKRVVRR